MIFCDKVLLCERVCFCNAFYENTVHFHYLQKMKQLSV